MVRKPATLKMAQQATDAQDPAYQDLYIPRKKGDPTGQSALVNTIAQGLQGESDAVVEAAEGPLGQSAARPISLREKTRFPAEANTAGITQGAGPGPSKQRPIGDLNAYLAGLVERFGRDPLLLDLLEQSNSTPMVENPRLNTRFTDSESRYA